MMASDAILTQVWESNDDGRTWTQAGVDFPSTFLGVTLDSAPSDPRRIYVSGRRNGPTFCLCDCTGPGRQIGTYDVPFERLESKGAACGLEDFVRDVRERRVPVVRRRGCHSPASGGHSPARGGACRNCADARPEEMALLPISTLRFRGLVRRAPLRRQPACIEVWLDTDGSSRAR
ncbi:hypothetical protein predicted by Glimmer/Critica [Sorangium cellulosum So ce56]|uniref:Uncharacterized protein n=1 Tax=Sorangium cellulosum (strain So ce56) TaxID=448385 RepID=A9FXM4_SORC5|nr:hypothetical protein predicted by Glimmer/Critica [Sorangium cellulosum So ce56]